MVKTIEGGCLCGAVRYTVTADALESSFCHCRQCQQSAGAPVSAWVNFPRRAFSYSSGAPATFASSGRAVREHCSDCGSPLVFRSLENTETIDVNASTLDNPEQFPPEYHIWFDERVSWMSYDDDLPRYAGDAPED